MSDDPAVRDRYDVVMVGGGHNALVAAAYLGRAGLSVRVLERAGHVGGAAVSGRVFAGVDARLSRYSYLVSLLPDRIVAELGLRVTLRVPVRGVVHAGATADGRGDLGLLVERDPGPATAARSARSPGPTPTTPPGATSTARPPAWPRPWRRRCSSRCRLPTERAGRVGGAALGRGSWPGRWARRSRRGSGTTRCGAWC